MSTCNHIGSWQKIKNAGTTNQAILTLMLWLVVLHYPYTSWDLPLSKMSTSLEHQGKWITAVTANGLQHKRTHFTLAEIIFRMPYLCQALQWPSSFCIESLHVIRNGYSLTTTGERDRDWKQHNQLNITQNNHCTIKVSGQCIVVCERGYSLLIFATRKLVATLYCQEILLENLRKKQPRLVNRKGPSLLQDKCI